jgi:hypothetical protein
MALLSGFRDYIMSRVGAREFQYVSARLYPDNPDENRALAVWERLKRGGMTGPQILTAALLTLDNQQLTTDETAQTLKGLVDRLSGIITDLNTNGGNVRIDSKTIEQVGELSASLKNSIKNRAQAGISLDHKG